GNEDTRESAELAAGTYVVLAVSDTGMGMSKKVQDHIFEPFFTTKESGQGSGLGLSPLFGIVKQSGGHIFVDSDPGHGSTFKIYFPASRERPTRVITSASLAPVNLSGVETILLVEDENAVRS